MRTIDPEIWSTRLKEYKVQGFLYKPYGQQPPRRYEMILRKSLVDAVQEYWRNCSIPGVKYIKMEPTCNADRYYYILCFTLTLVLSTLAVSTTMIAFVATPSLVINGYNTEELISHMNFPAVAVCSNNIISGTALDNYTEYIYNHPKNRNKLRPFNRSTVKLYLSNVGALLSMALPSLQQDFEELILKVEPKFNITDFMFKLSPSCSSLLRRCSWRGRLVPCETLFAARSTSLGFCCVFNSRYYPEDSKNKPYVLNLTGQNQGLGFVLKENREDLTYVRRNAYGAQMLIFEGSEYPIIEGGEVQMYPVPQNNSMFASVSVLTQYVDAALSTYSEERRGCRVNGPGRSYCLAQCRRDTAMTLCNCVPYNLYAAERTDDVHVCSLHDLTCLHKYREKFMYTYPWRVPDEIAAALPEELHDSMLCSECVVPCDRRVYRALISNVKYELKTNTYRSILTKGLLLANCSVVRLFYSTERQQRYVIEPAVRWYQLFAKLNAQWMMVGGVSVLCAVELIYHCTIRWLHHFVRRTRLAKFRSRATSIHALKK